MPVVEESCSGSAGGDDGFDRQRCSCLPFCFWGAPAAKRRRWRRRRLRLSWLAWPWSFRKGAEEKGDGRNKGKKKKKKKKKRRVMRLLLLLTASLQPKKALESVVSGDGALLPAKVSSFGDAKKKSNRKPRATAGDEPSGSSRHPQASTTGSGRWTSSTATGARSSRPEATTSQPSPGRRPGAAGRIWRAPSRRHTFHQPDSTERPGGAGGLWTAATTLGVIVLFGRVTAVVFLCSCLYGARFVRVRLMGGAAGGRAKAKSSSARWR